MDTCPAKTLSESFTIKVKLALIHHQPCPVGRVKNTLGNPPSLWEIPLAQWCGSVSVIRLVVENKPAVTVEKTSRKCDFAQEMCSLCVRLTGEVGSGKSKLCPKKKPLSVP